MKNAKCPSCKKIIHLEEKTKVLELITCPHCISLLELVNNSPPTLDWAEDPAVNSSRKIFTKQY